MKISNRFYDITPSPDPKFYFISWKEESEVFDKETLDLLISSLRQVREYIYE